MTTANLSAHNRQLADGSDKPAEQVGGRIRAAAEVLDFGDALERVVDEQEQINAAKGKGPMDRWFQSRDERLFDASYRTDSAS
jgi:hypothetical protein